MFHSLEDRPTAPAHVEPILSRREPFITAVQCHNNIDLVLTSERILGLDRSGKHQLLAHFTIPRSLPIGISVKPQGTHIRRLALAALGLGLAAVAYFVTISSDRTITFLFTAIPLAAAAWLLLDALVLNRLQLAISLRIGESTVKLRASRRRRDAIHKLNQLIADDHPPDRDDPSDADEPPTPDDGSGGDADPEPGKDIQV